MDGALVLWLALAFTVKHFICDFPLQAHPWLYSHKGEYGHIGGITHALIHTFGTTLVMMVCDVPFSIGIWAILADGIVHYHIDWAKMRLNAHWKLGPTTSEAFWILLGADQLAHYLTYLAIIWWVMS